MGPSKHTCSICGGKHHAKGLCTKHYVPLKNKAHYEANKDAYAAKTAAWRAKNPERVRELCKTQHEKHKEKRNAASAVYRAEHLDRMRELGRAWYAKNVPKALAHNAARRAAKIRGRRPANTELDKFVLSEIYSLAKLRTKLTGLKWHVDHIVPLLSKKVCGLHCAANLRLIPAVVNHRKGNRVWPHMPT